MSALNPTSATTVAVEHFPEELPRRLLTGRLSAPFARLRRVSSYKRNPRDAAYMRAVLEDTYGDGVAVVAASTLTPAALREASEVVLLWPDGNGFGWSIVERRVRAWKSPSCRIFVLNGRCRCFELTPAVQASYLARRVLERFWIGELVFSVLFFAISPWLVAWDLIRGHR
jgi:hypothetical protein